MPQSSNHKIRVISDEEIISKSYGEVSTSRDFKLKGVSNLTNRRDFIKNRAESGGLYDPRIFGMVGLCKCQRTRVVDTDKIEICPTCGVPVAGSEEKQSEIFGHYVLPYAYVSPIMIDNLKEKIQKSSLGIKFTDSSPLAIIGTICDYSFKDGKAYPIDNKTDISTIGLTGLYNMDASYRTTLSKLLVIPSTSFRPCYPKRDKDTGDINIVMAGDTRVGIQLSAIIGYIEFSESRLQKHMTPIEYSNLMYNFAVLVFFYHQGSPILVGGKFHSVRDLTRSTIESSLRATISPALDMPLNHIRLPRGLAYHALDEQIKDRIKEEYGYSDSEAKQEILNRTNLAEKTFEKIINNETVCLWWRNPTLYKNSIAAAYPEIWDAPSIAIPLELCVPTNADFDGDQIGVCLITDPRQYKIITENMTADKIVRYEKSNAPIFVPDHEQVLGLYLASKPNLKNDKGRRFKTIEEADTSFDNREIEFDEIIKVGEMKDSYGRLKISNILGVPLTSLIGSDYINKKNIAKIVSYIYTTSNMLDRLKRFRDFGILCVSLNGMDIPFSNVYDMNDPELQTILDSDKPIDVKKDEFNAYIQESVKKDIKNLPDTNFGNIVSAGARVKDSVLADIYAPAIKVGADGKARVEMDNGFNGTSEETFVAKSLDNRIVQELKRSQTPFSGYVNRQLVLANSNFVFDAQKPSPDKVGLELEGWEAEGRTRLDGSVVESDVQGKVIVKSCLNHKENVVHFDEVSRGYNEVDGANISISFASALGEGVTQSSLGLKHGRSGGREFTEDQVFAEKTGNVVDIGQFLLIVNNDGTESRFFVNKSARLLVKIGDSVSNGTLLMETNKPIPLGFNIGQICSLADIQPTIEYAHLKRAATKCLCISPIDGYSQYKIDKRGNPFLVIKGVSGECVISLKNIDETFYYPEGHYYHRDDNICTGVLDLSEYRKYASYIDTFNQFKKQFRRFLGNNMRSEILEVVYKNLAKTKEMSISKSNRSNSGELDLLQRTYYGDVKRGMSSYFKNKDEIKIEDSMILDLLLDEG